MWEEEQTASSWPPGGCAAALARGPWPPTGWVSLSALPSYTRGLSGAPWPPCLSDQCWRLCTRDADRGSRGSQCSASAGGKRTEQRVAGGTERWRECGWHALLKDLLTKVCTCGKWCLQKQSLGALIVTAMLPDVSQVFESAGQVSEWLLR